MKLTGRHLVVVLLLGVLVGGCSSVSQLPLFSALTGKVSLADIEKGTLGKASSFDQQCKILQEWPGKLPHPSRGRLYAHKVSHRFTDDIFVQYFGKPYDQFSEEAKKSIRTQLIDPCIQKNRHWRMTFLKGIDWRSHIEFVRASFPHPDKEPTYLAPYWGPEIVSMLKRNRKEEERVAELRNKQDEFYKRCPPRPIPVDFSRNPLANRKYEKSALLYEENNLKLYVVDVRYKKQVNLVAIHEGLGEQDPILDLNPMDLRYSQKMLEHFNCAILPNVLAEWPEANLVHIAHYAKDVHLPNTFLKSSSVVEEPVVESQFRQLEWNHWVSGAADLGQQGAPNTLAGARAMRMQTLNARQAKADAYKQELATKRAKRDDEERQKRERTLQAGLVYKNRSYWSKFQSGEELEQLFSGERVPSEIFRSFYVSFVNQYSEVCGKHLPPDSRTFELSEITSGRDIPTTKRVTATIHVDPRFAPKYDEYQTSAGRNKPGMALDGIQKILRDGIGTYASDVMSDLIVPDLDMRQFVKSERCLSATMRQMSENVLRHATDQPSLQAAGQRIPQAAQESDAIIKPNRFTRFLDGCLDYNVGKKKQWCSCLDRVYQGIMAQEERIRYANDHQAWLDEVRNTQPRGKDDPRWRLYTPLNQCLD